MHVVTSFRAAAVRPDQLGAVMADYLALERARVYRRLCVTRFGALACVFGVIGPGLHWIPPFASWLGVGLCLVAPAWAWVAEMRRDWSLARRLNELPDKTREIVLPSG